MADTPVVNTPAIATPNTPAPTKQPTLTEFFASKKAKDNNAVNKIPDLKPAEVKIEAKETKADEKPTSKDYALLAKKQKEIQAREEQVAQQLNQNNKEYQEYMQLKALREMVAKSPLKALKELGLNYKQLYDEQVQDEQEQADPTKREIRELKARIEAKEKAEVEAQKKMIEQQKITVKQGHLNHLSGFINKNNEKYELLAANPEGIHDVYDLIVKDYETNGKKPSWQEMSLDAACDTVEANYDKAMESFLKLKKIQKKFTKETPPETPPESESKKDEPLNLFELVKKQAHRKSPAIGNQQIAGPVTKQQLSISEIKKEALKKLLGN